MVVTQADRPSLRRVLERSAHAAVLLSQLNEPWVQRFVIYDNGSTDGSRKILAAKSNVELRQFLGLTPARSCGRIRRLQNTCSRESGGVADWVVVTAIDELHPSPAPLDADLPATLRTGRRHVRAGARLRDGDRRIPIAGNAPCHGRHRAACRRRGINKLRLFNPRCVKPSIAIGGHGADPSGHVVYPSRDELLLLHYKHLGRRVSQQRDERAARGPQGATAIAPTVGETTIAPTTA